MQAVIGFDLPQHQSKLSMSTDQGFGPERSPDRRQLCVPLPE